MIAIISFILGLSTSFSAADLKCVEEFDKQKLELDQVQDEYDKGEKNIIDLLDKKAQTNQKAWDCGLVAKYNYCKYQQDLMNAKLENFEKEPKLETPTSNADITKKQLEKMVDFCIHPGQIK